MFFYTGVLYLLFFIVIYSIIELILMENKNKEKIEHKTDPVDVTKHSKFSIGAVKEWVNNLSPKKRAGILVGIGVVMLLITAGLLALFGFDAPEPNPEPVIEKVEYVPPEPTTIPLRLTGVQVEPEIDTRPVTGVMIENSVDARPQSGLKEAGVVFEAIAEGGITRFLALYQQAKPTHIGPIRSARPYYVRWAAGFDASYVHSGGSGEALALIRALGIKDLDHGNNPGSFDRTSHKYAPHNVYTSMERLDALNQSKGYTKSTFEGFERIEPTDEEENKSESETAQAEEAPAKPTAEVVNKINFDISSPLYNTSYTYNPETNTYSRVMAGQPHLDEQSGKQITPSVVIALITNYSYHPNGIHSVYANVGSGNVLVFHNGTVVAGKWSKPSDKAELKFTDAKGKPLPLQPGQTWITAIPDGRVSYSP
jgi:hypothetical protein